MSKTHLQTQAFTEQQTRQVRPLVGETLGSFFPDKLKSTESPTMAQRSVQVETPGEKARPAVKTDEESWSKPFSQAMIDSRFLCACNVFRLMPRYENIPDDFKQHSHPWYRWQAKWFFGGLDEHNLPQAKEGIDRTTALRHLDIIQTSWEPRLEHKEAAVAYLASLWFVAPT